MRVLSLCLLLSLLAACATPPPTSSADPQAALLAGLRRGGYLLYLRHAETAVAPESAVRDLGDCRWQRNLSEHGREQAAALGTMLRQQGIAVSAVETSGFCRTRQTAELVFGRASTVSGDLFYHVSQTPAEIAAETARLKARLGRRPTAGNVALVGHAPTFRDATGIELAEGQGAIVKPAGDGTFSIVGRLDVGGISAGRGS
ncbi:MAG: histidine phosphatase family protein [Reyranella sp.]|nr:histidine phosphatase family protein [Reyranella sp.]